MDEQREQSDHSDLRNFIFKTLPFATAAIGKGVILRNTDQYGFIETAGGIVLPSSEFHEKKYALGVVTSVGTQVDTSEVDVGDVITYQRTAAFRCPDGITLPPMMFRVMADGIGAVVSQPNLTESLVSKHWKLKMEKWSIQERIAYSVYSVAHESGNQRLLPFEDIFVEAVALHDTRPEDEKGTPAAIREDAATSFNTFLKRETDKKASDAAYLAQVKQEIANGTLGGSAKQ